jgi:hypothetical protein
VVVVLVDALLPVEDLNLLLVPVLALLLVADLNLDAVETLIRDKLL